MSWRRWSIAVIAMLVASACGESSHLAKTDADLARIAAAKADPVFSLVPPEASVAFGPHVMYGGDKVEYITPARQMKIHVDVHEIEQTVAYEEGSRVALHRAAWFYVEQVPRRGWSLVSMDCRPGTGFVRLRASKTIQGTPAALSVWATDHGRATLRVDVPIIGARPKPTRRAGPPPAKACLDFVFLERPLKVFEETLRSGAGLTVASFEGRLCPALEDRARRSALTDAERAFFDNREYGGPHRDTYDYDAGTAELVVRVRAPWPQLSERWRVTLVAESRVWKLCAIEGPLDDS